MGTAIMSSSSAPAAVRDRERLLTLEKEAQRVTLPAITAALSEAVTLKQVAEIIVGEGARALGAESGALYLYDAEGSDLELIAGRGLPAAWAPRIARALRSGEPVWSFADEQARAGLLLPDEQVPSTVAALPLSAAGRLVGVLVLHLDAPLREEGRAFVQRLAQHFAHAVDRACVHETERRLCLRLQLLVKAGELCSCSIDYETTLANVAASALPALGDLALLDVVEDDGARRVARSASGSPAAPLDGARFAALQPAEPSLHIGVGPELLAALSPDAEHASVLRDLGVRSLITVPLAVRERSLGRLVLAFGPSGRTYTRLDLEIAEDLARRAAVAIDNARVHRACREANRRSELVNRTKDEFLGVVSHELRTPLNAILGWAQLLRGPAASNPAMLAKGLRVIDKNARAQASLIEDILDVSRIISGKLRLDHRPLPLESVVRAAIDVIRPAADAKRLTLHVAVDARPAVVGDPDRLQQIVWNLLSNAVKFTPEGGRVEIRLRREGPSAVLRVRDSGCGIEPEFLPYVFDRFLQADASPTRRYGGLGLGLAIVRHMVELHGGTVRAASGGRGLGATFSVTLPAHSAEEYDTPVRASQPLSQDMRLDGLKVLAVDDEADARELVAVMLGAAGADVAVASSAQEAFETLSTFSPDVLVSDVGMPGEDGYALLRRVRASDAPFAQIPALALTAYASVEDARRAVSAGFHTHLSKPAEAAMLVAAIQNLGGRHPE